MTNEKYESPDIQVISIEPNENLMNTPTVSMGAENEY